MQGSPLDLREQPGLAVLARLVATMHRAWPDAGPLLVGAMARDVLLSFAHGIRVARATTDMDFAFGLDGWNSFAGLRNALLADGSFAEVPGVLHRLVFEQCHRVDLLPFGGVERADRSIAWPSPHVVEMTMLGYREAAAQAVAVRLPDDVVVAVASLPAQAVLKLLAWRDRRHERPGVDAGDLRLLLRSYLEAGNMERLYADASQLLEASDYDHARAGAWLLGHDARKLLHPLANAGVTVALDAVLDLLATEIDPDGRLLLIGDMRSGDVQIDLDLLGAFHAGLRGAATP
jgi:predicted nucleotidyltransferase